MIITRKEKGWQAFWRRKSLDISSDFPSNMKKAAFSHHVAKVAANEFATHAAMLAPVPDHMQKIASIKRTENQKYRHCKI